MGKVRANYSNKDRPVKGEARDVIHPRRQLFTRDAPLDPADMTALMKSDLIRMFADMGLVLQNTHTMADRLVKEGWVKTRTIVRGPD